MIYHLLFILTTFFPADGCPPPPPPPPLEVEIIGEDKNKEKIIKPSPTKLDFEQSLKILGYGIKSGFDLEEFQEISLFDKTKDKSVKVKDLPLLDQHLFCLTLAYKNTIQLDKLESVWKTELTKFDNPAYELIKKLFITDETDVPATKTDIEGYINELHKMRRDFAVKYEEFAAQTMEKFKDKISQKERNFYIKKIKERHDAMKLVDRDGK